jgi:hypothetical protein
MKRGLGWFIWGETLGSRNEEGIQGHLTTVLHILIRVQWEILPWLGKS